MPWIRSEFEYHISVLLENGCQWTTSHRAITKPYSDTVAMPDDVLTGMLKELAERRRTRDEKLRLAAFTQLKEARPSVERRLESLKDREETLSAGEYLLELSQVALDLYDLGGRRAARSLLYSRFQRDIQKVTLDARLRIGLTLLNWEVAAGNNFETMSLLESLTPEFEGLEPSDERKLRFMRLRIMAIDLAGAYDEAKSAIIDAIPVLPTNEQPSIEAELAEMSLLRGDITRSED
jgi:hypothetical protein